MISFYLRAFNICCPHTRNKNKLNGQSKSSNILIILYITLKKSLQNPLKQNNKNNLILARHIILFSKVITIRIDNN